MRLTLLFLILATSGSSQILVQQTNTVSQVGKGLWILTGTGSGGAPPSSATFANLLLTFESGADNDPVDATYLAANDIGEPPGLPPATWSIQGVTPTVSTEQTSPFSTIYKVWGVERPTAGGTRSLEVSQGAASYIRFQFEEDWERFHPVNLTADIYCTVPQPDTLSGAYDYVSLANNGGGEFSVSASRDWSFVAHSSGADGSGVAWNRATWYRLVVDNFNVIPGSGRVRLYNTSLALVGESTSNFSSGNTNGVRFVEFGLVAPHAAFPTGSIFYDNVAVTWTNTGTCHPIVALRQAVDTPDFQNGGAVKSQSFTAAGETICKARIYLSQQGGAARNMIAGFFSAATGGTQYGSDSAQVTLTATATGHEFAFSDVTLPTGTVYLRVRASDGGDYRWRGNSAGGFAGGQFYIDGAAQVGWDGQFALFGTIP